MSFKNEVGNRLKKLRLKAGLTQVELAKKSGLSVNFIGEVERGQRGISIKNLKKILLVISLSMDVEWNKFRDKFFEDLLDID